jgi:hypothetical protein
MPIRKRCNVRTLDTSKPRIGSISHRNRSLRNRFGRSSASGMRRTYPRQKHVLTEESQRGAAHDAS